VLFVNSYFPPWRGGAETYVYNLSKQLRHRGHEVKVICGNAPLDVGLQVLDKVEIERLRITGRIYGTPIIPELPLKLACEDADIIHANFPSPFNAYFASATSRLKHIPAVLTWHNDLPPVTTAAKILVQIHDHLVLPSYISQFSFLVATSELYAKTSRILSMRKEHVVVIENGVDAQRFNPSIHADDLRSQLKLDKSRVVIFVGALTRWHGYKGLDVLMKSIAMLKHQRTPIKLLVVGAGDLSDRYCHLAAGLGIGNYVIFAGNVPDDELPKYYAASDVLVLPSKDRSEGFGLTILEANATGKPVIGTDVGGIPSVIRNGYNGLLVPPNDYEALAQTIIKALENEQSLRQMGKNGRALAERFDWSIVAEKTEKLYSRAIGLKCSTYRNSPHFFTTEYR